MIKFLLNGLLRDRQRSLFPILIVAIGVWITVFMQAYIEGVLGDIVDSTARFATGHVKTRIRSRTTWLFSEWIRSPAIYSGSIRI